MNGCVPFAPPNYVSASHETVTAPSVLALAQINI